jgi:hypothetical protein
MFGYHTVVRHLESALVLGAALLIAAACSGGASNQAFSGCVVTSSLVGTSTVQLTVNCSGGSAPYTVSSVSIGGVAVTQITGTTTGFSGSTVLTATMAGLANGQIGSMSVYDSSSGATPQSYSFTVGSSSILSGSTGCTISASVASPAINQLVTYTFSVTGSWGIAPYTFSSFNPGTNGTTVQSAVSTGSTQGTASATYPIAGSPTATVSVTDSRGSLQNCNTQISVGGGGTGTGTGTSGTITCTISGSYNSDGTIAFELTSASNPSDPLAVTSFDPGLNGTIINSGYPFIARYTAGGTKTVTATAYSTTTNAVCNVTPFVFNLGSTGSGTTTSGSCPVQLQISSSSVMHGTPVTVSIASGSGYSLYQLVYPTNAGVSGTFTSSTSVQVTFPYSSASAGYSTGYPMTAVVRSSSGTQVGCSFTQTVY